MEKAHRNLIKENIDVLVAKTHDLDEIVEKLLQKKILNPYMAKYIFEHPDKKGQNTEFYDLIQRRGPNAFRNLTLTLRETNNLEAEDILNQLKVTTFVSPNLIKRSNSPAADDEDGVDFCKVEDLVVEVHPEKIFMDLEERSPCNTESYTMRSKPRGLALIINIYKARNHKDRKASRLDFEKIKKLFSEIGYQIIFYSDLTAKEIKDKIHAFSMNKDLLQVDSLVIFIMSHGRSYNCTEDVELVGTDGLTLRTSWIISQFTTENPHFVKFENKPKLFFFQACRVLKEGTSQREIEKRKEESPPKLGKSEHTLVVYSTCTGSPSMRDIKEGAWFVGEFCKVVAREAYKHDLEIMLCAVENAVGRKKDEEWGEQHMEIKKRGIRGKIYFNPGL